MFRITDHLQALRTPAADTGFRRPGGPVVIWNLLRRCNLACRHCYSISADVDFPRELTTPEVLAVMRDLRGFGVPALILSGGEPLLRPDIFEISRRAKALGFYVALSTNGTLIDDKGIDGIVATGYDYVGISIDGIGATHDRFRRRKGAFEASLDGIRRCRDAGVKVGMRFTLTRHNAHEIERVLELMAAERVDKLYVSHLNYAGRGNRNRGSDVLHRTTRRVMDLLFDTCWADLEVGRRREFVTGNNDADGVYLLHWVRRHAPARYATMRERLARCGGNGSGVTVANIDNLGNVHPDTFWWGYSLGNVRERPFSAIWSDTRDPLLAGLKASPRPLKGRCRVCPYGDVCGGNTRVRALQVTGDPWWQDPGCYLDDAELGIDPWAYRDDRPDPAGLGVRRLRLAG